MRYKNINLIIDFDSTLVKVEALDLLADITLENRKNKKEITSKIKAITQGGMEGKISFDKSLEKRLKLFSPHKKDINKLIQILKKNITRSAFENIDFFRQHSDSIYIVSGGFKEWIIPVAKKLGITRDHVIANSFLYNGENDIVGYDKTCLLTKDCGKVKAVRKLNLKGKVVVVGDGYTAYEIKKEKEAEVFIAYTEHIARENIVQQANYIVKDFYEIIDIFKKDIKSTLPQKVLLLENIDQQAQEYFQKCGYKVEAIPRALPEKELIKKIKDVTVLGIRSKTKVTASVINNADRLSTIGAFCIGTEQIDMNECLQRGIAVFNAPYANTRSVAELAIGEIIMLLRKVFEKNIQLHSGIWNKSSINCHEIRGKKLGIIGYGSIGSQVSVFAESLGMKVYYYDIKDKLSFGTAEKCQDLHALLSTVDVVTLHIDGRKENKNYIGDKEFRSMKNGVIFLNLSRGLVVDINALVAHLKSGKIAGAAVDVFAEEPEKNGQKFTSPLQNFTNVILTPHTGGSTEEAQRNISTYVSQKIVEYLKYTRKCKI
ncbi:MAG: hypothetical protein A2857_05955 [Candidatus Levybacteria bacterium RIFCSPHIGHO2_01_FULL_36_15]|nr:MAG: hypothetical protein A2857_05955 [Candidatus Levybacteria bacterium RIFCSPHIGHO2_01_FULL_36_15]